VVRLCSKLAYRAGDIIVGNPVASRPLPYAPGFKVLHLDHLDFQTTCVSLPDCLR
jgi:hypothetical protein